MTLIQLTITLFMTMLYIFIIVDIYLGYKNLPKNIKTNKWNNVWKYELWGITRGAIVIHTIVLIMVIFKYLVEFLATINWDQKVI